MPQRRNSWLQRTLRGQVLPTWLTVPGGLMVGTATGAPVGSVLGRNSADVALTWAIDSGSTAAQYAGLDFRDRGVAKWGLGKDTSNQFYVAESGVGNWLVIAPGGAVTLAGGLNLGTGTGALGGHVSAKAAIPSLYLETTQAGTRQWRLAGAYNDADSISLVDVDSANRQCWRVDATAGDAWFVADVSALSFTDRTPYPERETALAAVRSMRRRAGGGLDHGALHDYVRGKEGRNLSATVSAQNAVIQDLLERVGELERRGA